MKGALARLAARAGLGPAQLLTLAGILASMVFAVVLNVLAARHFRRWDWTEGQRYTLTPATLTTLHDLHEPIEVWVMLGGGDPLEQSVKQLMVAYQAETDRLQIRYVDPDRDLAQLDDLRRRFKIETGRTDDGRVVTDAVVVVAKGDKHWFLAPSDMFEVSADDTRAKPREEQAITGAIRNVLGGEKTLLCFTAGHGEPPLSDGSDIGLLALADLLRKDNYDPETVDTTDPTAHEPFAACGVVVVASPRAPFSAEETNRLRAYLLAGGNLLALLSPINATTDTGMEAPGLDAALAPFGIALDEDLVFEVEPKLVIPESRGIRFITTPHVHPVTAALVPSDEGAHDPPRVVLHFARSLHHGAEPGAAAAVDLLTSSEHAFGVKSIAGAAEWTDVPQKKATDYPGPLVLAMASERPKVGPWSPHGPRAVVIGSGSVVAPQNWREPGPAHGAAFLVENAISWLAAKPAILDVPEKPTVAAGIRITEDSRAEVRRYVLVFMPLASGLLGLAIALWRRSSERAPQKRNKKRDKVAKKKSEAEKLPEKQIDEKESEESEAKSEPPQEDDDDAEDAT